MQQVQVVWSDIDNKAPFSWISELSLQPEKFVFEIHSNNSLSNRFRPLQKIPTEVYTSNQFGHIDFGIKLRYQRQFFQSTMTLLCHAMNF